MYATDRKGRVVEVIRSVVFGMMCLLDCWLRRSGVSKTIATSFVEGNNATDRGQNARKRRKTYCFSKSERMHDAATYFVSYVTTSAGRCGHGGKKAADDHPYALRGYNFCWEVQTRRVKEEGAWRPRDADGTDGRDGCGHGG